MRIPLETLYELADKRGYARESVLGCIVSRHECGMIEIDVHHKDYPHKPGLGDMVKAGLSAIGITEERVSAAIGKPCGCSERAEKLNELGRRIGIG